LPLGEYKLEMASLAEQKTIVSKYIFLGGSKDSSYQQALKDKNERLKKEVLAKIKNLKDLTLFLDVELSSTIQGRGAAMKIKVPKARQKYWNDFHNKWMARFDGWSKKIEAVKPQFTAKNYAPLIENINAALITLKTAHEKHNNYFSNPDFFTKKSDPAVFELQLKERLIEAKTKIEELKSKFTVIETAVQALSDYPEGY
jgi:hypothetical protein